MKNRIITNTGNSAKVKMGIDPSMTWEQFRAAAIAGNLPADIVATTNGTGTSQVGTPLTADTLLKDATATALGVTSNDPTVNEAFESLEVTQEVIDALEAIGITISGGVVQALLDVAQALGVRYVVSSGAVGNWYVTKYSDGTFDAWYYSSNGSTGSMQIIATGTSVYYSTPAAVTFPSIGITSVQSCDVACAPSDNYIMTMVCNRVTTTGCYAAYLRFGSGSAASNIKWRCHVRGTYE